MLQMKALQGYISPRFEWICPKCDAIHFVDVLDFFKATAGGSGMKCDVCRIAYEVKIELLDPRSPTLRAAVQSEQGGTNTDSSYDEFEGTTFNPKKYGSSRPNRSAGG